MKKFKHEAIINRVIDAIIFHNIKEAPLIDGEDISKIRASLLEEHGAMMESSIEIGVERGYPAEMQEKIVLAMLLEQ